MKSYYDMNNKVIAATKAATDHAFQTLEGLEAQTMMITGNKPRYYINGVITNRKGAIRCINEQAPNLTELKHSAKFNIVMKYKD